MSLFMNTLTIKAENDIYELLCNDDLYEFTIDNLHYANYIIYTDNFGIKYRVFIHDALLYNDIEFFVETFDYKNKLIILAYEKDLPMIVLLEYNENLTDKDNNYIFKEVEKQTEVSGTIIQLSYNSQKNIYEDANHNEYKILNKDNSKINKIIRHYKLIQKSADKQEQIVKFNDESLINYSIIQLSQNPENYSPWVIQASFKNIPGQVMLRALDSEGFFISTGSACSSRKNNRPVLEAMNLSTEIRENAVRFSFGATTTKQAMDELIKKIEEISNRFN